MAESKTRPTGESVVAFIAAIADETKRQDAHVLAEIMERVTGAKPVLWGPSIVGFGAYTYTNSANKSADWPLVGFSPRKANLTLYIVPGFSRHAELMQRLGKHTTGKSCLYIKRLSDIDLGVLEDLVTASVDYMRETYPTG